MKEVSRSFVGRGHRERSQAREGHGWDGEEEDHKIPALPGIILPEIEKQSPRSRRPQAQDQNTNGYNGTDLIRHYED